MNTAHRARCDSCGIYALQLCTATWLPEECACVQSTVMIIRHLTPLLTFYASLYFQLLMPHSLLLGACNRSALTSDRRSLTSIPSHLSSPSCTQTPEKPSVMLWTQLYSAGENSGCIGFLIVVGCLATFVAFSNPTDVTCRYILHLRAVSQDLSSCWAADLVLQYRVAVTRRGCRNIPESTSSKM